MLTKQIPLPQDNPKFLRHSISVEALHATTSRSLYRGVAKSILNVKNIEGCQPKKWKLKDLKEYNVNNLRISINTKISNFEITKPKNNFFLKPPKHNTKFMQRTWNQDKLAPFKKDKASNFLYPTRFALAETDSVSWKFHMIKDFENNLPNH